MGLSMQGELRPMENAYPRLIEALDAQVRKELRKWLREIHDATGHTTVFVTHDQEEALELADRVVVMSQGNIEQVGTSDEVYDTPNSPFVYGFIGESSVMPVMVRGGELWAGDRSLALAAGDFAEGPAQLFFRPHDIDILDGRSGGIGGTVAATRRVAGTRHVELNVDGLDQTVEIELPVNVPATLGERIVFRPSRWKLFAA